MQDDEVLSDNRADAADFFNFCVPTSQQSKSKGRSSRSALSKNRTLARVNSSESIADAIEVVVNDTSFDVQKIKENNYKLPSILALIEKQKAVIQDLSSKVSFLLSYLRL